MCYGAAVMVGAMFLIADLHNDAIAFLLLALIAKDEHYRAKDALKLERK